MNWGFFFLNLFLSFLVDLSIELFKASALYLLLAPLSYELRDMGWVKTAAFLAPDEEKFVRELENKPEAIQMQDIPQHPQPIMTPPAAHASYQPQPTQVVMVQQPVVQPQQQMAMQQPQQQVVVQPTVQQQQQQVAFQQTGQQPQQQQQVFYNQPVQHPAQRPALAMGICLQSFPITDHCSELWKVWSKVSVHSNWNPNSYCLLQLQASKSGAELNRVIVHKEQFNPIHASDLQINVKTQLAN